MSWYEVNIAGRKFRISTRSEEAHIREVEQLLELTYREVTESAGVQPNLQLALLTALNLADQLIDQGKNSAAHEHESTQRMTTLAHRLEQALQDPQTPAPVSQLQSTAAESEAPPYETQLIQGNSTT